jgi:hypothetical protein
MITFCHAGWMGGHWLKRMKLNDPKERKKVLEKLT